MQYPVCPETNLVMSDRQEGGIDYCPKYRGIWLDRGEPGKIIERSTEQDAPEQPQRKQSARYQQPPRQQHGHHADKYHE